MVGMDDIAGDPRLAVHGVTLGDFAVAEEVAGKLCRRLEMEKRTKIVRGV